MSLMRVLLFTPATHTEYIDKAAASGTDGAIIDLEDGASARRAPRRCRICFACGPIGRVQIR